jgi:REP element-mobilizing transposase RayT
MARPLAYFLTWTTSGTWLHGDERGSKDRDHRGLGEPSAPADAGLRRYRQFQLGDSAFLLDSSAKRAAVREAVERTAELRGWRVWALNVRTNHVHVALTADGRPEPVMTSLKAWATKGLVAGGLAAHRERVWTRHGSTRYVWDEAGMENVCRYVRDGQGADLD